MESGKSSFPYKLTKTASTGFTVVTVCTNCIYLTVSVNQKGIAESSQCVEIP